MIKVGIIDDHSVLRLGLRHVLALDKELQVVAESDSGSDAARFFAEGKIDVLLLDIRMPGVDGLTALREALSANKDAKIIMLTTSEVEEDIYRALKCGAAGYLLKSAPPAEMINAVKKVASGGRYVPDTIERVFEARSAQPDLSPRELEVLKLMSKGLSNPEIGDIVGIAPASVKTHLLHVFEKLGVADRTEAATAAMSRGII